MSDMNYRKIMIELQNLPTGGITYKKINGRLYAYYQWREGGKQHSRRAKDEELEELMAQIERRKELETLLRGIEIDTDRVAGNYHQFCCAVRVGEELKRFARPVAGWEKRECYTLLRNQSAFLQIQSSKTLDDVNRDLRYLEESGYRYVFLDEVTLLEDFIEGQHCFRMYLLRIPSCTIGVFCPIPPLFRIVNLTGCLEFRGLMSTAVTVEQ